MNGMYSGIFVYTDDIALLSPSVNDLNFMVQLCEYHTVKNRIMFDS